MFFKPTYFAAVLLIAGVAANPTPVADASPAPLIVFEYPKTAEQMAAALSERSVLSNGERAVRGMSPAFPRALAGTVPKRSRRSVKKNTLAPRASPVACALTAPVQTNPRSVLLSVDDALVVVVLPFAVSIFGNTATQISITTNGFYEIGDNANAQFTNNPLPSAAQPASIFAYWDDLITNRAPLSGEGLFYDITATTLTIRHFGEVLRDVNQKVDITTVYDTAVPGVWTVYYTRDDAEGSSATIGAQGIADAGGNIPFVQYSVNAPVIATSGSVLRIDTNAGTVTALC